MGIVRIHRNTIIAHHHVVSGYGTWLANDPRGSGSTEVRNPDLQDLGPVHHGRKRVQPPRSELKALYREAEPRLGHDTIWFDPAARDVIAAAAERAVREFGYTCYAFWICSNHGHALTRVHRDKGELIWEHLALAMREALLAAGLVPAGHPVWALRPYLTYKSSVSAVRAAVDYVNDNPGKEGLPRQRHSFVSTYDGWPFRRRNAR